MSMFAQAGILCLLLNAPDTFVLGAGAPIADVAVEDVDGDGCVDIAVLCVEEAGAPSRYLAVFCATAPGMYLEHPATILPLGEATGGLFFTETDGKPPRELAAVDMTGARVYSWTRGTFVQSAEYLFASLFPTGVRLPRFLDSAAWDLDGDGIDEWLIPEPHGYRIRKSGVECAWVPCATTGAIASRPDGSEWVSYRRSPCRPVSLPEQTGFGIASLDEEHVQFAIGPRWERITRTPIPFQFRSEAAASRQRQSGAVWAFPRPPTPEPIVQLYDMNRDGLPDLIVTETRGVLSAKSTTRLYYANSDCTFSASPNAVFDNSGFVQPILVDVNRDESPDLLFLQMMFGLRFIVNYLTGEKVTLRAEAHLNRGGVFSAKPDLSSAFVFRVPSHNQEGVFALGDFNGDSRLDVVFGDGGSRLVVHTGEDSRFIASTPWITLNIESEGLARTCDLDNNDSDDLIVFQPAYMNKGACTVLVF